MADHTNIETLQQELAERIRQDDREQALRLLLETFRHKYKPPQLSYRQLLMEVQEVVTQALERLGG